MARNTSCGWASKAAAACGPCAAGPQHGNQHIAPARERALDRRFAARQRVEPVLRFAAAASASSIFFLASIRAAVKRGAVILEGGDFGLDLLPLLLGLRERVLQALIGIALRLQVGRLGDRRRTGGGVCARAAPFSAARPSRTQAKRSVGRTVPPLARRRLVLVPAMPAFRPNHQRKP